MRNLPVHWYEGVFLRPQHFQAADRHWSESLHTSQQWENQYNYGLRQLDLNHDSLANSQIQIASCQARMRDGTLISLDPGQEPDRVDLKPAFANESSVTVYLALPKVALGRVNVDTGGNGEQARFTESSLAVQDESLGGNDVEIQFRHLNLQVLLSTEDLSGYEVLPIARVKRSSAEESVPELDEEYIPPLLATDAWQPLAIHIVRGIYDIIGEKIDVLSQRAVERKQNLSSQQPGDLDDLLMLTTLNQAHTVLHVLTFAQSVHPFVMYQELCRTVGMLAIFSVERRISDIPPYDHDDLARIFRWVRIRIEQLLGSRKKLEYEQRYFVGTERGMQVSIEPAWLHADWDWFVGVNAHNISGDDCRELLRPGKLDWKLGSSEQIDLIFRYGVPGVELLELTKPPRALPPHGWIYYEVQRESAAWKDVLATQTLAMRFKEELIGNIHKLAGQQRLEVILPDKSAVLEAALFAVHKS